MYASYPEQMQVLQPQGRATVTSLARAPGLMWTYTVRHKVVHSTKCRRTKQMSVAIAMTTPTESEQLGPSTTVKAFCH